MRPLIPVAIFPTVLAFVFTSGCLDFHSAPNGIYTGTIKIVQNGGSKSTSIALDTPEVRELITTYEAKEADIREHLAKEPYSLEEERHQIMPIRTTFLDAMTRARCIVVKENTRCRILEISTARCSPLPEATITYLRVLITNGPLKGQQAWICRNAYSLPFESP